MPKAELVHDKCCVAKHLGEAVDQVRRAKSKAIQSQDDDRLKEIRQSWFFNESNLSRRQRCRFAVVQKHGLEMARVWGTSELFRWFWRYVYPASDPGFFRRWYTWAVTCRPWFTVRATKMQKLHLPSLLACPLCPITNARNGDFSSFVRAFEYVATVLLSFASYPIHTLFFCWAFALGPCLHC